ncbi:hemin degrading protein [Bartonella henselae]|uniref:Hemin degrading protein n=2 Tax=Bartonella TaxID=773 RepID=X5M3R8_BARHN|nr:hemin-degrading factor [Bartonella henselae]MDM9996370.1 hemin-degrading factor [Bartonella henselae]OLL48449.1 hemin degrading protein [Bartonella henselae]OLL48777.1 hemin degrading protein [Bartonella henselae]OLL49870.1 hemin degrading protein [Bartonella henselae]OLL57424.1 hemin degrading protein [Bartonella henselae]
MSYTAEMIIRLREEKKEMRNRDFAISIGISEAELIAAYCTIGKAKRLKTDIAVLLENAPQLGTVMALTRNEHAVHEITGCFEKIVQNQHVLLTLGEIDLRIFAKQWKFCFEYEAIVLGKPTKSLHFFDQNGVAIFKLYSKDTTNMAEWNKLVDKLLHEDQSSVLDIPPKAIPNKRDIVELNVEEFRDRWRKMTDVHQLHGIISELKINRHDAVKYVGNEFAHKLKREAIEIMLNQVAQQEVPIMCFVGNKGCIQIFSGQIKNIKQMGPWLNVLDKKFHLHLLIPGIKNVWCVRKPTSDGHVTSLEVFDENDEMIIQFFGMRKEGQKEREDWRSLLNSLPQSHAVAVA